MRREKEVIDQILSAAGYDKFFKTHRIELQPVHFTNRKGYLLPL